MFEILAQAENNPYFVGWGTLALINAVLAQIKHDNAEEGDKGWGPIDWFILSIFIGPFATFFLLFKE